MSAKNSTIYIHIGTIKTGTTSLQQFFHLNRKALQDNFNIYYPKSPGPRNHTKLPLYAFDENVKELRVRHDIHSEQDLARFRRSFKAKFTEELRPHLSASRDILLSSEHLSSRAVNESEIQELLDLFSEFNLQFRVNLGKVRRALEVKSECLQESSIRPSKHGESLGFGDRRKEYHRQSLRKVKDDKRGFVL